MATNLGEARRDRQGGVRSWIPKVSKVRWRASLAPSNTLINLLAPWCHCKALLGQTGWVTRCSATYARQATLTLKYRSWRPILSELWNQFGLCGRCCHDRDRGENHGQRSGHSQYGCMRQRLTIPIGCGFIYDMETLSATRWQVKKLQGGV